MKIQTDNPTTAALHIMATELDTNIKRLEDATHIPANLRAKRMRLLQERTELRHSTLTLAKDSLEIEKARLLFEITDAVDEKGKARYSNPESRSAAFTLKSSEDQPYKEVLAAFRSVEKEMERIELAIQEVDEEIKTASEINYAARLFVQGSVTALQAIVAFDGPRIPSEIALRVPEMVLKAPESMPAMTITLQVPETLPSIHLLPTKGVA